MSHTEQSARSPSQPAPLHRNLPACAQRLICFVDLVVCDHAEFCGNPFCSARQRRAKAHAGVQRAVEAEQAAEVTPSPPKARRSRKRAPTTAPKRGGSSPDGSAGDDGSSASDTGSDEGATARPKVVRGWTKDRLRALAGVHDMARAPESRLAEQHAAPGSPPSTRGSLHHPHRPPHRHGRTS